MHIFTCKTPGCNKGYTITDFQEVSKKTGFIELTNNEFKIFGIVCPACGKTTLNRYPVHNYTHPVGCDNLNEYHGIVRFYNDKFIPRYIAEMEKIGSHSNCDVQGLSRSEIEMALDMKGWEISCLREDYLSNCFSCCTSYSESESFALETNALRIEDLDYISDIYPDWYKSKCVYYFNEKDIVEALEFENKNQIKIFPRKVHSSSIYHKTEKFLDYLKGEDVLEDIVTHQLEGWKAYFFNGELNSATLSCYLSIMDIEKLIKNIIQNNYIDGAVKSNITEEDFQGINAFFQIPNDCLSDFIKNLPDMLLEYITVRNKLDFDISYKTDFLDKYILLLCRFEGNRESSEKVQGTLKNELLPDTNHHVSIDVDCNETDFQEILTYSEILKRWGKDVPILKSFIFDGRLSAYNHDKTRVNPDSYSENRPAEIQPENYLYKKSEVEELELHCGWLKKAKKEIKEQSENEENKPINEKEIKELEQLRFEKEKWDVSINAAVKIGIWAGEEDGPFKVKTVKDKIESIETEIPITTFEIVWQAIPAKKKHPGYEKSEVINNQPKKDKTDTGSQDSLTGKEVQELGRLKTEKKKWDASINAAFHIGMWVTKIKDRLKRAQVQDKLIEIEKEIADTTFQKIWKAIPDEKRNLGGRPKKKE